MPLYRHRQLGKIVLATVGAGIGLILALAFLVPAKEPAPTSLIAATAGLLAAAMLLFGVLTVEVTAEEVVVSFGVGLVKKRFRVRDIRGARRVRTRWYYGWGIRRTPTGWMFNVSGLDAGEIELVNGRRFRIGTDDPERLLAAIKEAAQLER